MAENSSRHTTSCNVVSIMRGLPKAINVHCVEAAILVLDFSPPSPHAGALITPPSPLLAGSVVHLVVAEDCIFIVTLESMGSRSTYVQLSYADINVEVTRARNEFEVESRTLQSRLS